MFWFHRMMFETASHIGSCTTEEIEKKVKQLQTEYMQEPVDYLKRNLRSVAVLVDGVVTQVPVKNIKIIIDLDLNNLETEKSLSIRFGSKLHELLSRINSPRGSRRRGLEMAHKQVAQLRGAGYVSTGGEITDEGESFLWHLSERGPNSNGEERKLCRCLLEMIGTPRIRNCGLNITHDHLFEQDYINFVTGGGMAVTNKGMVLLEKHADHLMTLKSFDVHKDTLISFLSKDKLPEYLTSPDSDVRRKARLRCNTIEEETSVNKEETYEER